MDTSKWPEKPLRGELKIGDPKSGTVAIVCPTRKHAGSLKDIDVIRLELKNAKGQRREFWMTPDEASEIASVLSTAVMAYLNFKFEPYQKKFGKRRNKLSKRLAK